MRLLVLDLASHTGFCFGTEAGVEDHGTHHLPITGNNIGLFLSDFRRWLCGRIGKYQPDEIVFEMPILPAATKLIILRKLYALCGETELTALDMKCECSEANLIDIRRHFIGRCRAPSDIPPKARRPWMKEQIVAMCRKRGFRPADDNAADALALFSFVMSLRHPGFEILGNELARAA